MATATCATDTITLNDGRLHPAIGYGTYKVGVVPASASSAVACTPPSPADVSALPKGVGYLLTYLAYGYPTVPRYMINLTQ